MSGEERQHQNEKQGGRGVPKVLLFSNNWDEKVAAWGKSADGPEGSGVRQKQARQTKFGLTGGHMGEIQPNSAELRHRSGTGSLQRGLDRHAIGDERGAVERLHDLVASRTAILARIGGWRGKLEPPKAGSAR